MRSASLALQLVRPLMLVVIAGMFALQVGAQTSTTWTGTLSSVWSVAGNWTNGAPDATKDAVIGVPSGAFTPSTSGVVGAACRTLNLQSSGSLDFAIGFPLDVNLNATIAGAHTGTGLLRLVGSGSASSSGTGSFPDTEITGTYTLATCTIHGNLTQTSAAGILTIQTATTTTVNGNATFQGLTVNGSGGTAGTLNVRGDIAWATINPVVFGNGVTVRCGGNWTAGANFAPITSTVTFDGSALQTVTGGPLNWFTLVIAANANVQVTSAAAINVGSLLTINATAALAANSATTFTVGSTTTVGGTLTTSAQFIAGGQFNLNNTGSVVLGAGQTHLFSNNLTISNAPFNSGAGSTVRLQGTGSLSTSGVGSVQDTEITGTYTLSGGTINGNLTQTIAAGQVTVGSGSTTTVNGNATFQGLRVNGSGGTAGTLNVRGDIAWATINPVVFGNGVTVRCGGNWTAGANFAPITSTVTFDGSALQTVTGGPLNWFTLVIAANANVQVTSAAAINVGSLLTINATAALAANSATTFTVGSTTTVGGTLTTSAQFIAGGQFNLNNTGSVVLGAGQTHLFSNNLTISNAPFNSGAGSTVRLQGTGSLSTSGVGSVSDTEITGTYTLATCTINGNLTQAGAAGQVTIGVNASITVNGNASFQGTTVNGAGTTVGTLNVRGDITWATINPVVFGNGVTVRCGGNWNVTQNFAPITSAVTFDGTGTQTATGNPLHFFTLIVDAGATLDIPGAVAIDVTSLLTVQAGGTLTANSATTFTVGSTSTMSGTFSTSALFSGGGQFNLNPIGSVTLGAGQTHLFGNNVNVSPAATFNAGTGSILRLQGTGTVNSGSGAASLPTVEVTGTYTFAGTTINGDLTQTSTAGQLTVQTNQTILVSGNGTFQGTTVNGSGGTAGTLNVRGVMSWATSGLVLFGNVVELQCGGDWNSNANFQPLTGSILFNGTGTQIVTAVNLTLRIANVGNTSNLVLQVTNLTVQQDLTVDGTLNTQPASTTTVGRNLTVSGTTTGAGVLVMDGSLNGAGTLSGTGTISNVKIDTTGTITANNATLSGDLEVAQGILQIAASSTLHVNGLALLTGGTLSGAAASTLDLNGNVTLTGTTAAATLPDITCAGDWTADPTFQPTTGTVTFDPTLESTVNPATPGGTVYFNNLTAGAGTLNLTEGTNLNAPGGNIQQGATVKVNGQVAIPVSTVINNHGNLEIGSRGILVVASGSVIHVFAGGVLNLTGTPQDRATLAGLTQEACTVRIDGSIRASYFALDNLSCFRAPTDRGGIQLNSGATVLDFSDGILGGKSLDPNGALLWIANGTSFDGHDITFENHGTTSMKNVATALAAPSSYRFFNYDGNLGGAGFEEDPNNIVQWLSPGRTTLSELRARGGPFSMRVLFRTSQEIDTTSFRVFWSATATGPWTEVPQSPVTASGLPSGASYEAAQSGLLGLTRYYYEVYDERPNRPLRWLGRADSLTWPDQLGNARFVGSGAYADIDAAVTAANPGDQIVVAAGTYSAFTINKPVTIVSDGSGPVVIDTTLSKLLVTGIPAGSDVALYDLQVGSASGQFGMEAQNCGGVLVFDGVEVTVGNTVTALRIDGCPQVALQKVTLTGGVGLDVINSSLVFAGNSAATTVQLANAAHLTYADCVFGTPSADPTSVVTALVGSCPRLEMPSTMASGEPFALDLHSDPFDFWVLRLGLSRGFLDLSPFLPVDMVLLVNVAGSVQVASGLMPGNGLLHIPVRSISNAGLWGDTITFQLLVVRPTTGRIRMCNVRDCVFVP